MEVDRASVEQLAIGYKREPVDPFNFILSLHFVKVTDLFVLSARLHPFDALGRDNRFGRDNRLVAICLPSSFRCPSSR